MTPPEPAVDPTAVILARMEVKLDNALTEQAKHGTTLDRHDRELRDLGNRMTAVETAAASEQRQQTSGLSARAVMWAAIGTVGAILIGVLGLLLTVR